MRSQFINARYKRSCKSPQHFYELACVQAAVKSHPIVPPEAVRFPMKLDESYCFVEGIDAVMNALGSELFWPAAREKCDQFLVFLDTDPDWEIQTVANVNITFVINLEFEYTRFQQAAQPGGAYFFFSNYCAW